MGKTVAAMVRAFQKVNVIEITKDVIVDNATDVEDLNRKQLYKGLDANGKFLSPKYSEDPWFTSKEAALRYAEWKKKITPDPDRPLDVPNLFITGRFHYSRTVEVEGSKIAFRSNDPNANKIKAKFKNIDGLTDNSIQAFRKNTLYPQLVGKIAQITGVGIRKI